MPWIDLCNPVWLSVNARQKRSHVRSGLNLMIVTPLAVPLVFCPLKCVCYGRRLGAGRSSGLFLSRAAKRRNR